MSPPWNRGVLPPSEEGTTYMGLKTFVLKMAQVKASTVKALAVLFVSSLQAGAECVAGAGDGVEISCQKRIRLKPFWQ